MKRLVALCGALVLTLAMAAPVAADQKVHIPWPYSGEDTWVTQISQSSEDWYWEGWACTKPIWYKGDFKNDLWLWYPKGVDTTDPGEYMPDGEPWPWKRGMTKTRGTDTYAANPDFKGKVLRNKLRLSERLYAHKIMGDVESWKVKQAGKDFNLTAPGVGPIFKSVGNWRYTITITDGVWEFSDFVHRGPEEFYDTKALCDYFDAGPVVTWEP